jgi:hypothetical protein
MFTMNFNMLCARRLQKRFPYEKFSWKILYIHLIQIYLVGQEFTCIKRIIRLPFSYLIMWTFRYISYLKIYGYTIDIIGLQIMFNIKKLIGRWDRSPQISLSLRDFGVFGIVKGVGPQEIFCFEINPSQFYPL